MVDTNTTPQPISPTPESTPKENPVNNQQWQESVNKAKDIAKKLNSSEKAIAGGAIVVLVSSFLPAYSYVTAYYQYSQNNLYSSIGWLNFLAAAAALLLIVLPQFSVKIPTLPWPNNKVQFALGAIAAVCSVIQLLNYVFDGGSAAGNPAIGIFLVVAGSILMAYTSYNDQKNVPTQTPPPTSTSEHTPQS